MLKQHTFANFNRENSALYINIPYCETACSYCHYKDNIFFGYNYIPHEYFALLLQDLKDVCGILSDCCLKSIYFGGGTPSLLSNAQLSEIRFLLEQANIIADEISIELYPKHVNFDLIGNDFFTRYSIAAQSFDNAVIMKYRRRGYDFHDILELMRTLRENVCCNTVNIDLIFDENLPVYETVSAIEELNPDTVTIYPNTKGRGTERLANICRTLLTLRDSFRTYKTMFCSSFIFVKEKQYPSRYSVVENESFGDIIGIGHNSISMIGNKSFLTRYADNRIYLAERKDRGERYLKAFAASLPTGVRLASVTRFFPVLMSGHFLAYVSSGADINEKHSSLSEYDLVYLPATEYVRFYRLCMNKYPAAVRNSYLSAIGYGDSDEKNVLIAYNTRLLMSDQERYRLRDYLSCNGLPEYKLPAPMLRILIEGIDGSGKDTFARFLAIELKRRFFYGKNSTISIMGQPDSSMPYGQEAKRFIENLDYESKESVIKAINENRTASENKIRSMQGICILIRGLVTDIATFHHVFPDENISSIKGNTTWDYYIIIDTDENTADARITRRKTPRTWRESIEHLRYFREFYLSFENPLLPEKIVIENISFAAMKDAAERLANEIYAKEYSKSSQ